MAKKGNIFPQIMTASALILLASLSFSCFFLKNLVGEKVVIRDKSIYKKFEHKIHQDALSKKPYACLECHAERFSSIELDQSLPASRPAMYEKFNAQQCHTCHRNMGYVASPQRCDTCHTDIKALRPDYHRFQFLERHAFFAADGSKACDTCHRPQECIDCHEKRNFVKDKAHQPNYRYTHSIEARANPARCDSCHNSSFCTNCHQNLKMWR